MFGVLQVIDRNLILKHVPPAHQNHFQQYFSYIGGRNWSTQRKTTDLSQVTDKLYRMLYQAHLTMNGI
jgi:hypothetical protein